MPQDEETLRVGCVLVLFDYLGAPWTAARQAPLSMGFSRQEYWSGLPFPSPGDLPNPGADPKSPALQASLPVSHLGGPGFRKCVLVTQAPLSMGFSRQGCWSGLPFSSSGDHLDPGIEPGSPALQADSLGFHRSEQFT